MQVDSRAELDFGSSFDIPAAWSVSGAGTVSFSGGTVNDTGSYSVSGLTSISGGTFNYSGSTAASTGSLTETGGTLTGTGTVNVTGLTTWSGGSMTGSGVTNADGGLCLGGTAADYSYSMFLDQRTFNNDGAGTLQPPAACKLEHASPPSPASPCSQNQAAGSFTFTDDNSSIYSNGGTPSGGTFENDVRADQAGEHRKQRDRLRHHVQRPGQWFRRGPGWEFKPAWLAGIRREQLSGRGQFGPAPPDPRRPHWHHAGYGPVRSGLASVTFEGPGRPRRLSSWR